MCVGICMYILNDSIHFTFTLSFSLPLLSLQLRPCLYRFTSALAPQSPSCLPGFTLALLPSIRQTGPNQLSFYHSSAPGPTVDSHYSIILNLHFSAWPSKFITGLFCPPPISPIFFLIILLFSHAYRPAHVLLISVPALCL